MKRLLVALLLLASFGFAQTTCVNCGGGVAAITENGTNVISTEMILVPSTNSATVAGGVGGATTNGINFNGSSNMQFIVNGLRGVGITNNSDLALGSNWTFGWDSTSNDALGTAKDLSLGRRGAANLRLGTTDVNGVPVAQTISVQNAITGTDLAGSTFTLDAPLGTGAGAGASTKINRAQILATGTTSQTSANALVVCESKILSNTSATAQTLANIALASNSAGGASGTITVTATDGTNFDSETQSFNVSYVNKATVGTVGTPAITASTAANNSGSATIGMTATFSGTTLSIKVTPVFTTIVPTIVTSYIELNNHGAGAVTCQ